MFKFLIAITVPAGISWATFLLPHFGIFTPLYAMMAAALGVVTYILVGGRRHDRS